MAHPASARPAPVDAAKGEHASLARLLCLQPLDRVQLNDQRQIREIQLAPQLGQGALELPYLFFQRVLPNGLLELRSPGGQVSCARTEDICDVIAGRPVKVRAMPRATFVARLALPYAQQQQRADDACYASASVLYVEKDRWGRVDRTLVWFDDDALNDAPTPWAGVIHQEDRASLESMARRANMPVMSPRGGANYSASEGLSTRAGNARYGVQCFVTQALQGRAQLAHKLACIDLEHGWTPATINRMIARQRS